MSHAFSSRVLDRDGTFSAVSFSLLVKARSALGAGFSMTSISLSSAIKRGAAALDVIVLVFRFFVAVEFVAGFFCFGGRPVEGPAPEPAALKSAAKSEPSSGML